MGGCKFQLVKIRRDKWVGKLIRSYLNKLIHINFISQSSRITQLKDCLKVMSVENSSEVMQYLQAVAEGYFYL